MCTIFLLYSEPLCTAAPNQELQSFPNQSTLIYIDWMPAPWMNSFDFPYPLLRQISKWISCTAEDFSLCIWKLFFSQCVIKHNEVVNIWSCHSKMNAIKQGGPCKFSQIYNLWSTLIVKILSLAAIYDISFNNFLHDTRFLRHVTNILPCKYKKIFVFPYIWIWIWIKIVLNEDLETVMIWRIGNFSILCDCDISLDSLFKAN